MEEKPGTALGTHVLAEYFTCDQGKVNDPVLLEKELVHAATLAGASVVSAHFHTFSPYGVSGVVVIKESHFALHSWPEHHYAAVDFFTCSPKMDFEKAYHHMATVLQSAHHFFNIIPRGEKQYLNHPHTIPSRP